MVVVSAVTGFVMVTMTVVISPTSKTVLSHLVDYHSSVVLMVTVSRKNGIVMEI